MISVDDLLKFRNDADSVGSQSRSGRYDTAQSNTTPYTTWLKSRPPPLKHATKRKQLSMNYLQNDSA